MPAPPFLTLLPHLPHPFCFDFLLLPIDIADGGEGAPEVQLYPGLTYMRGAQLYTHAYEGLRMERGSTPSGGAVKMKDEKKRVPSRSVVNINSAETCRFAKPGYKCVGTY